MTTARRHVILADARFQYEARTKHAVQLRRGVSRHGESAALRGSVLGERRHQNMSTRAQGTLNLSDVALPIFRECQEMKHRAIVPYINALWWKIERENICGQPRDARGQGTKALPGARERGSREVQHCDVRVALGKKSINQRRSTAAHIHNSRIRRRRGTCD